MTSKHAAILTNRLLDWNTATPAIGGGERYTIQLASLLIDNGFDVTIYQITETIPYSIDDVRGFKIVGLQTTTSRPYVEICNEFYRRTGNCSIRIITMPELATGKVHGGTILTVQGTVWFGVSGANSIHWILDVPEEVRRGLVVAVNNCSEVVTTCNHIDVTLGRAMGAVSPSIVINHGIDTGVFSPPEPSYRANFVLFPGRAEKVKGTETYKAIYDDFHCDKLTVGWDLIWCGNGPEYGGLKGATVVGLDSMPLVYKSSKISCTINNGEIGTSLTLLEAMACGCACIAISGTQDVIQHGHNGLLVNNNPIEVYSAIIKLIQDDQLRNSVAEYAIKTILDKYDIGKWKDSWMEIIEENVI